jgi:excisionase family DNA binding protein
MINMNQIKTFETTQDQLVARVVNELKNEYKQVPFSDHYLTKRQLTELLTVSLSTVNNWTSSGVIQAYQLGGKVYYKSSEIECSMIKLVK